MQRWLVLRIRSVELLGKKFFFTRVQLSMTLGFSSLKIEDNDEELSSIFGIELLATQTNSKGGKDIAQVRA